MQVNLAGTLSFALFALPSGLHAQGLLGKTIRIVTSDAGSGQDFAARLIAQGIAGPLGQSVVIDNRAGSVAFIAQSVLKAAPDGNTLMMYGNPTWLLPLMQDNVGYDLATDFVPITLAIRSPNALVVHPSLPVKSVRELVTLAKARPGQLNYAAGSNGAITHLAGELFKSMAGVNIVRIPYKSAPRAVDDLLGGRVEVMFPTAQSVVPHLKSGRLRALATASARPTPLLPGLSTISDSGLPGYESTSMYGLFAPTRTPEVVVHRLTQEIVRVLNTADVKEKLLNIGSEVVASTPEQFAAAIKVEVTTLGKIIRDHSIRMADPL